MTLLHEPRIAPRCRGGHAIADAADDNRALREAVTGIGAKAVISSNPTRKHLYSHDGTIHRLCKHIERRFNSPSASDALQ